MPDNIFITYSHPDETAKPSNRRRVAQHIATHHRNRSAPASRIGLDTHARQNRRLAPVKTEQGKRASLPDDEQLLSLSLDSIPRDRTGFRDDPFAVLPTRADAVVTAAIDYCKISHPRYVLH